MLSNKELRRLGANLRQTRHKIISTVINRLNKSYFTGEYALIDSLLHTTIDYHLLQSMLVGNDLTQYDVNKFKSFIK